jgi:hypothetical protein
VKLFRVCLLSAILALACAGGAGAVVFKAHSGHRVSLTLRRGVKSVHGLRAVRRRTTAHAAAAAGELVSHGGPVLHSEKPYLIYWEPGTHKLTAANKTVINTYMSDVAADSGQSNNVYGVLTQYTDTAGPAAYRQTFGSSQVIDDTQRYPVNTSTACPLATGLTACVTDAQLQAEVARLISTSKGNLTTGTGANAPIYFVVTPQDVNVCFSGGVCASNFFCAYHDTFDDGGSPVLYSSMPFAVWSGGSTKGCQDDGTALYQTPDESPTQAPYHGDHAYQVADNLSHELSETITDPLLNAWFNKTNGSEVGDLCEAWAPKSQPTKDVSANAYLPIVAGTEAAGDLVDQFFSGHYYYNQTEWSNAADDCLATP